jgi:hypothetical protein
LASLWKSPLPSVFYDYDPFFVVSLLGIAKENKRYGQKKRQKDDEQ